MSAAPDASFLFGLNEWIQNLECVTPSCTHRANSSGSGKGPPNPPISEPWLIMPDKQAFSWIACDPRKFFQLASSADILDKASVNSPRGVVSGPCRRSVFEGADISGSSQDKGSSVWVGLGEGVVTRPRHHFSLQLVSTFVNRSKASR